MWSATDWNSTSTYVYTQPEVWKYEILLFLVKALKIALLQLTKIRHSRAQGNFTSLYYQKSVQILRLFNYLIKDSFFVRLNLGSFWFISDHQARGNTRVSKGNALYIEFQKVTLYTIQEFQKVTLLHEFQKVTLFTRVSKGSALYMSFKR